MFKPGTKVRLVYNGIFPGEMENWAEMQGLVVGNTYTIDRVFTNTIINNLPIWISLRERPSVYNYSHPIEKFKIVTGSKSHLPKWW